MTSFCSVRHRLPKHYRSLADPRLQQEAPLFTKITLELDRSQMSGDDARFFKLTANGVTEITPREIPSERCSRCSERGTALGLTSPASETKSTIAQEGQVAGAAEELAHGVPTDSPINISDEGKQAEILDHAGLETLNLEISSTVEGAVSTRLFVHSLVLASVQKAYFGEGFGVPFAPPAPLGIMTPAAAGEAPGYFSQPVANNEKMVSEDTSQVAVAVLPPWDPEKRSPWAAGARAAMRSSTPKRLRKVKTSIATATNRPTSPSPDDLSIKVKLPSPPSAGEPKGSLTRRESGYVETSPSSAGDSHPLSRETFKMKGPFVPLEDITWETSLAARGLNEVTQASVEATAETVNPPSEASETKEVSSPPLEISDSEPGLDSGLDSPQTCSHPCNTCRRLQQRLGIRALREAHMSNYAKLGISAEEAVQMFNAIKGNRVDDAFYRRLADKGGDIFVEGMEELSSQMNSLRSFDVSRPASCTHPCRACETQPTRDIITSMAEEYAAGKEAADRNWEAKMRDLILTDFAAESDLEAVEKEHGAEFAALMRDRIESLEELQKGVARGFGL